MLLVCVKKILFLFVFSLVGLGLTPEAQASQITVLVEQPKASVISIGFKAPQVASKPQPKKLRYGEVKNHFWWVLGTSLLRVASTGS